MVFRCGRHRSAVMELTIVNDIDCSAGPLNVLVVGSSPSGDPSMLKRTEEVGIQLGRALGESPHCALVCSAHVAALDYHVIRGIAAVASRATGRFRVFRPFDRRPSVVRQADGALFA